MTNIRRVVLDQMPPPIIEMVNTLEKFSNTMLVFEAGSWGNNPGNLATLVDEHQAVIQIPKPDLVPPASFMHELLHIRRFWVDGIPQLEPKGLDPSHREITGEIESELEHLVIIPQQRQLGFDDSNYWHSGYSTALDSLPFPSGAHPHAVRKWHLLRWLATYWLHHPELQDRYRTALIEAKLLGEAELFKSKAISLIADKPRLISCAIRFLQIPANDVHLIYYDVRARTRTYAPIPAH